MIRVISLLGLLGVIVAIVALRKRFIGRALRLALAGGLPLATVGFCLYLPQNPMIIFAWGYGDLHLFQPLKTNDWSLLSIIFREDATVEGYVRENWDGRHLFVDGWCGVCGEPYGPRNSFVFAILPKGFAYATHRPHPKHQHLGTPRYVSQAQVLKTGLPYVLAVSLFLGIGPWLANRIKQTWLIPLGHCQHCGFDLTGNESGTCPECGKRVAPNEAANE